jgi:hypothetical protein
VLFDVELESLEDVEEVFLGVLILVVIWFSWSVLGWDESIVVLTTKLLGFFYSISNSFGVHDNIDK